MLNNQRKFIITLSCPDRLGIVAEVSTFLAKQGCNIVENSQFEDSSTGLFFLRTAFTSSEDLSVSALDQAFRPIADRFSMQAHFYQAEEKVSTLLMVSQLGHCLNDLLYRWQIGALPISIKAIVSNHRSFERVAIQNDIPFHYLPITPANKQEQELALTNLIASLKVELVVLARYMQVLSDSFCERYPAQIINIHHSLLPSFKGAKPYHQAFDRGVKLIGATAHFVTAHLDEGPIIDQDMVKVSHKFDPEQLVAAGRQVETAVLSNAVKLYAERRILSNGKKTVVFT